MIDERHLLTLLKLWKKQVNERGTHYTQSEWLGRVIEEIKIMPKVGGWIPCSSGKLPENYETVNITWVNRNPEPYYEHIKDKPFTGTAVFYYGEWYWYSCVCEDYLKECGDSTCDRMDRDIEVIAWMPLPEHYKEEVTE